MSTHRVIDLTPHWSNPAPYVHAQATQLVHNFAGILDAGPAVTITQGIERLRARGDGRVRHAFVWIDCEMVEDADVLTMSLGIFVWLLGLKGKVQGTTASLEQARLLAAIWGRENCSACFDWTRSDWSAFAAIPWRWSAGADSSCAPMPTDGPGYIFGIPRRIHEPLLEASALS